MSPRSGKPEISVPAGFGFWRELPSWLADSRASVWPHMVERGRDLWCLSLSIRIPVLWDQGFPLMIPLSLI